MSSFFADLVDEFVPKVDNHAMEYLITGAQIRMARGLLRWSVQDLAERASVGTSTVKKLERGYEVTKNVQIAYNEAVRDAFLATGIVRFEPNACIYLGKDTKSD